MADRDAIRIKGTIALAGGRAFFVPACWPYLRGKIMANKSVETFMTDLKEQFNTRRGFLTGAAGVIATGAALQLSPDNSSSLKEMASELHDAIGQFTDENLPSHVQVCADGRSLELEIEPLQHCSVDEILEKLRPMFEGGAS